MDDLTGREFERLTVLSFVEYKNKHSYWKCRCKCGNILKRVSGCDLKRKHTRSCGCLRKEVTRDRSLKHGDNKNSKQRNKLYGIWSNLKCRCKDMKTKNYKDYAGRGITYDPRWNSYAIFKKEMWYKWTSSCFKFGKDIQLSIERKDVNGNYCKENCIFIPMREQSKNQRRLKWFKAISPDGKEYYSRNKSDFGKLFDLSGSGILMCLRKEWKQYKGWTFSYVQLKKKPLISLKG